jgi:5'/3'-nucleotidase SurE
MPALLALGLAVAAACVPAIARAAADATPPAALCGQGPLEILLSNDDGAGAAGIRALRAGLQAAGHRVTMAAPDYNASGSGLAFTWGAIRVTRDPTDPSEFAIGATPATTVVLAASALYPPGRRPDLVVSGINHGSNAGSLLMLSGTLGAALAGTLLLDPPVPGIAVSAERLEAGEPVDSAANLAQLEAVGGHAARLIGASRGWFCKGGRVAHPRTVLNVNYPARRVADLAGVVVARQGSATDLRVSFAAAADGRYEATTRRDAAPDERGTDRDWLARGYATVTPVTGMIGDGPPSRDLQRRLRDL